jgi:hypothetical protein
MERPAVPKSIAVTQSINFQLNTTMKALGSHPEIAGLLQRGLCLVPMSGWSLHDKTILSWNGHGGVAGRMQ